MNSLRNPMVFQRDTKGMPKESQRIPLVHHWISLVFLRNPMEFNGFLDIPRKAMTLGETAPERDISQRMQRKSLRFRAWHKCDTFCPRTKSDPGLISSWPSFRANVAGLGIGTISFGFFAKYLVPEPFPLRPRPYVGFHEIH